MQSTPVLYALSPEQYGLRKTASQKCEADPRRASAKVSYAHRLVHHSTLGLRAIKAKKRGSVHTGIIRPAPRTIGSSSAIRVGGVGSGLAAGSGWERLV